MFCSLFFRLLHFLLFCSVFLSPLIPSCHWESWCLLSLFNFWIVCPSVSLKRKRVWLLRNSSLLFYKKERKKEGLRERRKLKEEKVSITGFLDALDASLLFRRRKRKRDADGWRFRFTYSFLFLPPLPSFRPFSPPTNLPCPWDAGYLPRMRQRFSSFSLTFSISNMHTKARNGREEKRYIVWKNEKKDHRHPPKTDTVSQ